MSLPGVTVLRNQAIGAGEGGWGETQVPAPHKCRCPPVYSPLPGPPDRFSLPCLGSAFVQTDHTSLLNVGGSFLLKQGPSWTGMQLKEGLGAESGAACARPSLQSVSLRAHAWVCAGVQGTSGL